MNEIRCERIEVFDADGNRTAVIDKNGFQTEDEEGE